MTAATMEFPRSIPTAPGRVPLLGHIPRLLHDPVGMLRSLRAHGDLVVLYIGPRPVCVVNSPALLHHVLTTGAVSLSKGRMYDKARPVFGNGLPSSEGVFHHKQKRLMTPAFRRERLHAYTEVMQAQTQAMVSGWPDGRRIAMDKALRGIVGATAFKTLFGADLDDAQVSEIDYCIAVFFKQLAVRTVAPGFVERLPIPFNRRFADVRRRLAEVVGDLIDRHLEEPDRYADDLLSMLITAMGDESDDTMSRDQLQDEVTSLLVAAPDTTGSTLSWLFYELGTNPGVQRDLHEEVDTVLGGRAITFEDVPRLRHTQNVVSETLRLHSVSWFMMRRTLTPFQLGDARLPVGTEILFSAAALHRDPDLYRDPLRFDPGRWATPPPHENFVPFSSGPRKCIAEHFARLHMTVITATIAQQWRTSLVPGAKVREVPAAVLRPNRLPMMLEART